LVKVGCCFAKLFPLLSSHDESSPEIGRRESV
jgi:hypothetical protein